MKPWAVVGAFQRGPEHLRPAWNLPERTTQTLYLPAPVAFFTIRMQGLYWIIKRRRQRRA